MTFIKEILKHNPEAHKGAPALHRIIVRTNTYGSNFEFFQRLYKEAKKDFPHLKPIDADIKHYAGRRYKGTYGIEFSINVDVKVPKGYEDVSEVEWTL